MAKDEEEVPKEVLTRELIPPVERPVSAASTTISTASELSNSYSTDISGLKANEISQRSFTPPTRGRSRSCKQASPRKRPLSEPAGGRVSKNESVSSEKFSIGSFLPMTRSISQMSISSSSVISKLARKNKCQIPKHDWRILECLFLKYKKLHQDELKSYEEQKKWQLEREMVVQASSKQWEEWQSKINEKRLKQNVESVKRWRKKEQMYLKRHEALMNHIKSKETKLERIQVFRLESQLRQMHQQRAMKHAKREEVILSKNLQEKEDELNKQNLIQKWKLRQEYLANKFKKRNEARLKKFERDMVENESHCEKIRELQEREAAEVETKKWMLDNKLMVTEKNLQYLQDLRKLKIEKAKCQRELKQKTVLELHSKLETEFNYWRERILRTQLKSLIDAESRMSENLAHRSASVQAKHFIRKNQHQHIMERIVSKKSAEEESARSRIEAKGKKACRIAREKEDKIQISRETSLLCSLLREFMRNNKMH